MDMVSDALAKLIAFCGIGGLVCFILASLVKYSLKNRTNITKLEALKIEMVSVSIQQMKSLNRMYEVGHISLEKYTIEKLKIKVQLLETGNDASIIDSIPTPIPIDKSKLLDDVLSISSALNDKGEMGLEEMNEYINHALDEKKKIK